MAAINEMSADVTGLFKFYHTNEERFYPTASTASEQADEFYAVTVHTTDTTNRTIIRFIRDSAGTWYSAALKDAADCSEISLTGSAIGSFQRVLDKVYWADTANDVYMINPRRSAGDTDADYVTKAGIPDPNAELILDRMTDLTGWEVSYGAGAGSAVLDFQPTHRVYGDAAIMLTQENNGATSVMTYHASSVQDLTAFDDGTVAGANDFITFNVFRYAKKPIEQLIFVVGCDATTGIWTNYFYVPITMPYNAELDDLESSATWSAYEFRQNTIMAEWELNPHDNEFFRVRIRKSTFAKAGSPDWSTAYKYRFELRAGSQASASNPAKVTINDLKLMKSPPLALPYRVQWLQFEEQESGSTSGWQFTSSHTEITKFNRQMAKEGVSCIKINGGGANSPVASIDFASGKDFVTFADGETAINSCLIRYNLSWRGLGKVGQLVAGVAGAYDLTNLYNAPRMRFYNNANYKECKIGVNASLTGGGVPLAIRFNTANSTIWSGSGAGMDWTDVTRVEIYGPYYNNTAIESYYFIDDMRLEFPKASRPVNVFEPVDIHVLNAATEFTKAYLPSFAKYAELGNYFSQIWLRNTKYKTYGYGNMTYPDYEHGSFGLSGLTMRCAGGMQPFGVLMEIDGGYKIDLDNYFVPTYIDPFEWDTENYKFGFIQFEQIPGSEDDKFRLWLSMPADQKGKNIHELTIKFHANNGSGNADEKNYYEYRVSGQQVEASFGLRSQELKFVQDANNQIKTAIEQGRLDALTTISNTLKNNPKSVQKFVSDTIELVGKDRGGWASGIIEWKKSDMLLVRDGTDTSPVWSDIRGHSFEVTSIAGNGAEVCIDNLWMVRQGALDGTYWYKLLLQDNKGYLSPSSEPSQKVTAERENIQLTNLYVPNDRDIRRVTNKQLYRLGGVSSAWRHVKDVDPRRDKTIDRKRESDAGLLMPEEAYAPPSSKVMKAVGNIMYYANFRDRVGEYQPYRIARSEGFCPYRVSDFQAVDLPEKKGTGVTGLEEYNNYLCAWTPDGFYTVDKLLLETPRLRSIRGNVAVHSIQNTPYGLIWLSRDGLMRGNISQVDDKFFHPINPIFDGYTEEDLANAIGIYRDHYYFLFFDPLNGGGGRVVCCYLPDRLFSEFQSDAFDVKSACKWDGGADDNAIYIGRSNGEIAQFLEGDDDNGTAIVSELRSKDFTQPSIIFDKHAIANYMSVAKLGTTNSTITPYFFANQTAIDTHPVISAESTALKTFVAKASQGDSGTHLGVALSASHRHKITELVFKIEHEEDVEFHV